MASNKVSKKAVLELNVNGEDRQVLVPVRKTLLEVLREDLDLTGTKHGCELGECGACAVLIDGEAVLSCLVLPVECQAPAHIVTVEGLANGSVPDPLQTAFAELGAAQCGYCTPGMILCAHDLLQQNASPTEEEIRDGIGGNLCRCTGYQHIVNAVKAASRKMNQRQRAAARAAD